MALKKTKMFSKLGGCSRGPRPRGSAKQGSVVSRTRCSGKLVVGTLASHSSPRGLDLLIRFWIRPSGQIIGPPTHTHDQISHHAPPRPVQLWMTRRNPVQTWEIEGEGQAGGGRREGGGRRGRGRGRGSRREASAPGREKTKPRVGIAPWGLERGRRAGGLLHAERTAGQVSARCVPDSC